MTTQSTTQPNTRRWFAEPMMLLVVGIPLTSVIVSFVFLAIAISSFDGVVADDYYRRGKEINRLLQRDDTARRFQLGAILTTGNNRVSARISAATALPWPQAITLKLLHPTQKGRDLTLQLQRQSTATVDGHSALYRAAIQRFSPGEWIVQIETPDWRLMDRGPVDNHSHINLGSAIERTH
jgi:hypothetical protein